MAVLDSIPPALKAALSNPPQRGSRNVWLLTVAMRARHFGSPAKVRKLLTHAARQWTDRDFAPEIERAVEKAFALPATARKPARRLPDWPPFNAAGWARRAASPTPVSPAPLPVTAGAVLDSLFPGNPLLCCALDTRSAITQPRDTWRGFEGGLQFIVPNPMRAAQGRTADGRLSQRCLENACAERTYQVVEFDQGSPAEQAAILGSLSTPLVPLVLAVWSGGKSLHGWFLVSRLSGYASLRFFRHAVSLGADASLWDPSKLVRMPGGRRDTGQTQTVHFFKPDPFTP
jgi:hypothetical protein